MVLRYILYISVTMAVPPYVLTYSPLGVLLLLDTVFCRPAKFMQKELT